EPSLSSGVLRTLIGQSPAHAHQEHVRLGGKQKDTTPSMALGGYVHGLLSGLLDDYEVRDFDSYRSKDSQAWRDSVQAAGKTPVLESVADNARQIADAVRMKAAAGIDNTPFAEQGQSEVTVVWQEEVGTLKAWCRARIDRLVLDPAGFADAWDWKTTTDVSPDTLQRTIIDHGYDIQAAFYLRGLRKLLPEYEGRFSFNFVFVETSAPYAVRRV